MVAPLEQLTTNLGVGGSNPSGRANKIDTSRTSPYLSWAPK
jgi:hypothetical protein